MGVFSATVPRELTERFHRRAVKSDGCWSWDGSHTAAGYGDITFRGAHWTAHRLSYVIHKGEIGAGQCVCHTCDNPGCCNPDHLWLGSQRENMRDMAKKGRVQRWMGERSHCKNGHEYTAENTRQGREGRQCRTCEREKMRRLREKWRAA